MVLPWRSILLRLSMPELRRGNDGPEDSTAAATTEASVKLVALDLSLTATGHASWHNGRLEYGVWRPPGLTGYERWGWIRSRCGGLCSEADLVIMEGLSLQSNNPGFAERVKLAGLIEYLLYYVKVPLVICAPQSLKKFVVGHAGKKDPATGERIKVTKDLVIKELYKRFGHDVDDNNAADAIGLLYIGRGLVGEWKPTTDPQRAVLAALMRANAAMLERLRQEVPA